MSTNVLTDAHMVVLAELAHSVVPTAEAVAKDLGVPVDVILSLITELEAAGMIAPASIH